MSAIDRVLSAPHSLSARSLLAKELRETDPTRARFLELQLTTRRGLGPSNWTRVPDEIRNVLRSHGREWARPLLPFVNDYEFELGLVAIVNMSGQSFVEHGDELIRLAPLVGLAIDPPLDVGAVLRVGALRQIRRLSLLGGPWLDDAAAIALAECPYLGELRFLEVAGGNIGQTGIKALIASTTLQKVISIDVTGNPGVRTIGVRRIENRDFIIGRAGEPLLHEAVAATALGYDGRVSWPPSEEKFLFDDDE